MSRNGCTVVNRMLTIINREYVYKVNIGKKQLILADIRNNISIPLTTSKVALRQLKNHLESQLSLPSSSDDTHRPPR